MIAASPCALIIAIPIAYLSAVSTCAKRGILLKGGITLDALAGCHAIAFDKTGTLTTGELSCISFEPLKKDSKEDLYQALATAYAMEKNAVHPIATAITKYANTIKLPNITLQEFKSIPGYGLQAISITPTGRKTVYIGRPTYIVKQLKDESQALLLNTVQAIQERGELLTVLLFGDELFLFTFRDTPRPKISEMLSALKRRGMDLVMLTGDHLNSAKRIAAELDITEFHADLTPEDKLRYVTELAKKKGLAMIGDGVNDAPALARATVGMCMGGIGSTAAIDAADIVFLHDNIELLDWLIGKAKQTQRIVKENLILASAAILIASLPALAGIVPLWVAVIMHEGGTVLVGLNALRLLR